MFVGLSVTGSLRLQHSRSVQSTVKIPVHRLLSQDILVKPFNVAHVEAFANPQVTNIE